MFALVLIYHASRLVKKLELLSQPIRSQHKTNGDLFVTLSRACHHLHDIASSSDWFITLFAFASNDNDLNLYTKDNG